VSSTDYLSSRKDLADLRNRSVRAAWFTFAFNSSSTAIQTVGVIVLARILGPHDFGLVEMVAVFAFLLQTFSVDGFTEAVIQKDSIRNSEMNSFFWVNVLVSTCLALSLALAGPLIAWFYGDARLALLSAAFSLSVMAAGLGTQHAALLKRNFYFFDSSLAEFLGAILSTMLGLIMALTGAGYWSLVARRIAQPAIVTAVVWIRCRWRPCRPALSRETAGLAKFGLNIWGNASLHFFRENFDRILVGRFYGAEMLGHYGRAFHFSRLLPGQIAYPLSDVALSALSAVATDPVRFRRYFSRILETMAFVSTLAACLLTLVGPTLLTWLLGPQWALAGTMFAALGPGAGIAVLYRTHGWLHMSLGRPHRWWQWSIAATTLTVSGYLAALPYGPFGVAAAYSVAMHLLIVPALWFAGRPLRFSIGFLLKPIWRYWLSAFITCVVILTARKAGVTAYPSGTPTLTGQLWMSVESVALYVACVTAIYGGIAPFSRLIGVLGELRVNRNRVAQVAS